MISYPKSTKHVFVSSGLGISLETSTQIILELMGKGIAATAEVNGEERDKEKENYLMCTLRLEIIDNATALPSNFLFIFFVNRLVSNSGIVNVKGMVLFSLTG